MPKIQSGFVGLFWLDDASAEITDQVGDVEFFQSDLVAKNTILPIGTHRSYGGKPYSSPRGRVEVENGKIIISVGLDCPENTVAKVMDAYSLWPFSGLIEVKQSSFWDKRFRGV